MDVAWSVFSQAALSRLNPWWNEVVLGAMLRFGSPDLPLALVLAACGAICIYALIYCVGQKIGANPTMEARLAPLSPRARTYLPYGLVLVPFTAFSVPVIAAAAIVRVPPRHAALALILGEVALRIWMLIGLYLH